LSPAKATRPGYRQSMAADVDSQQLDQAAIHLFHPIYHCYTYPIGNRTDVERRLPVDLDKEDTEDLIDNFSEPPVWLERYAPLAVQIGDQIIRGKNSPDLMLKLYRSMFELFRGIGQFIESSVTQSAAEGVRVPFMSLCVDPDTLHRIIETDYELGEAAYGNLMKLYSEGVISPCMTTPFHAMLPLLNSDVEIRICIRSAFIFYLRIVRIYHDYLRRNGESGLMVLPFWLPECSVNQRVIEILREEFTAFCKKEKVSVGHLVILLDNHQAKFDENDVLMKMWNQVRDGNGASDEGRPRARRAKKSGLHEGVRRPSILFRDRSFSDWVIHASPSVKKLLDRTIAKVDSDINAQNVHYGWAHFEELESMTYSPRSIINFQQKLIKLTELGYVPLSPDFYVRGKLRKEFGCTKQEPQLVELAEQSVGNGWNLEDSTCFGRWSGQTSNGTEGEEGDAEAPKVVHRPYERTTEEGKEIVKGDSCWKIAWNQARAKCHQALVGDLESLEGGMAEVLAGLSGHTEPDKARRNVHDFLANYTYIYWREHFIQHDLAEADINILEIVNKYLRAGLKKEMGEIDCAKAGAAAQAIYFAIDSGRSMGSGWENMDQRAFYQNVVMLTLGLCGGIYVYHWTDDKAGACKLLGLIKEELLGFEGAYERYHLEKLAIRRGDWLTAIQSEIKDSADNVVYRAALRVAARHLRPLGYTEEFSRQDASMTTNVGHLWSIESCRENFCYENPLFCGVSEA